MYQRLISNNKILKSTAFSHNYLDIQRISKQVPWHMHRSLPAKPHMFEPWTPSPNAFTAYVRCVNVALVTTISTVQKSRKSDSGWPRYRQNSSRLHTPCAPAAVPVPSASNACLGAWSVPGIRWPLPASWLPESFRLVGALRGRNSNNTQNSAGTLWLRYEISSIKWSQNSTKF